MEGFIIAVDGPAGSGKGTVTKKLAENLGFINLDTGAIYRCITLLALRNQIPLEDGKTLALMVETMKVEFEKKDLLEKVWLNQEDVTESIRSKEVNLAVSTVSNQKEVRSKMDALQRTLAQGKNIIMEGRDIGTCIFPNADVKFYLDADIEERAKRRYKENLEKGIELTWEEVLESVKRRDENDKNRKIAPLKKAEDAITIDSTYLTIEEVVQTMQKIVQEKLNHKKQEENRK